MALLAQEMATKWSLRFGWTAVPAFVAWQRGVQASSGGLLKVHLSQSRHAVTGTRAKALSTA